MSKKKSFKSSEVCYPTLFHELVHNTSAGSFFLVDLKQISNKWLQKSNALIADTSLNPLMP